MSWKTYHTKNLTEKYLFKFIPFQRFEEFIKTGHIWFSRADKFGDKMECVKIADLKNNVLDLKTVESRKRKILISCWHLADKETVAMWDTYSIKKEDRKNIAMRFKRNDLITAIHSNLPSNNSITFFSEFIHGKVQYRDLINSETEKLSKARVKYAAFRKENAFSYEREYRFVLKSTLNFPQEGFGYNLGDVKRLKFDILINPLLSNKDSESLKAKINNLNCRERIKDSPLKKWFKQTEE